MFRSGAATAIYLLKVRSTKESVSTNVTVLGGATMEHLALDIGPLPNSNSGNRYILIVPVYFSKWIEVFPMQNQEASTVTELLAKKVVCRFCVPLLVHSGHGCNFESTVFTKMCQLLGTQKQ